MSPGSQPARAFGCICPQPENNYGTGTNPHCPTPSEGPRFVIASCCPVHGVAAWYAPAVRSPATIHPGIAAVVRIDGTGQATEIYRRPDATDANHS